MICCKTNALWVKILFLILISLSVYANDILTTYRINGIKDIQKQMDMELTKTGYWSKYLKNQDTTFGYIEGYSSVLTCNKEKSTLTLHKKENSKTFNFKKDFNAFTGEVKGDKVKEGDLKTPVGIYNLTKKISKVDSFYGPMAFVTSYPNIYDKYRGKNGHGIWIHGLPTEQERDDYTKGCIAINNNNIECLDRQIDIDNTLLIINQTEVVKNISKSNLITLLAQLYDWRYAWIYSDISKYLSFYGDDFKRYDGMEYEAFKKYKTRVFKKLEKKTITFNGINIIPYPNTSDKYEITFKELYVSSSYRFSGNKTLIVKLDEKNRMKILTEK